MRAYYQYENQLSGIGSHHQYHPPHSYDPGQHIKSIFIVQMYIASHSTITSILSKWYQSGRGWPNHTRIILQIKNLKGLIKIQKQNYFFPIVHKHTHTLTHSPIRSIGLWQEKQKKGWKIYSTHNFIEWKMKKKIILINKKLHILVAGWLAVRGGNAGGSLFFLSFLPSAIFISTESIWRGYIYSNKNEEEKKSLKREFRIREGFNVLLVVFHLSLEIYLHVSISISISIYMY